MIISKIIEKSLKLPYFLIYLKFYLNQKAPIVFKKGSSSNPHAMSKLAIKMIARSFLMHLKHFSLGIYFNCVAGSSFVFGVDSFKAGRSLRKSI